VAEALRFCQQAVGGRHVRLKQVGLSEAKHGNQAGTRLQRNAHKALAAPQDLQQMNELMNEAAARGLFALNTRANTQAQCTQICSRAKQEQQQRRLFHSTTTARSCSNYCQQGREGAEGKLDAAQCAQSPLAAPQDLQQNYQYQHRDECQRLQACNSKSPMLT
jgi:hypothetical protein